MSLPTIITELEKNVAAIRAELKNPDNSQQYVLANGRAAIGSSYKIFGTLYPDLIPPTGETEGFRFQRFIDADLKGVRFFTAIEVAQKRAELGGFAVPRRVWLRDELDDITPTIEQFKRARDRFGSAL